MKDNEVWELLFFLVNFLLWEIFMMIVLIMMIICKIEFYQLYIVLTLLVVIIINYLIENHFKKSLCKYIKGVIIGGIAIACILFIYLGFENFFGILVLVIVIEVMITIITVTTCWFFNNLTFYKDSKSDKDTQDKKDTEGDKYSKKIGKTFY